MHAAAVPNMPCVPETSASANALSYKFDQPAQPSHPASPAGIKRKVSQPSLAKFQAPLRVRVSLVFEEGVAFLGIPFRTSKSIQVLAPGPTAEILGFEPAPLSALTPNSRRQQLGRQLFGLDQKCEGGWVPTIPDMSNRSTTCDG